MKSDLVLKKGQGIMTSYWGDGCEPPDYPFLNYFDYADQVDHYLLSISSKDSLSINHLYNSSGEPKSYIHIYFGAGAVYWDWTIEPSVI